MSEQRVEVGVGVEEKRGATDLAGPFIYITDPLVLEHVGQTDGIHTHHIGVGNLKPLIFAPDA